jgi:hypothetical protein
MLRRKIFGVFLMYALLLPVGAFAQTAAPHKIYTAPEADIQKIRDEGMTDKSQVMNTLNYLTNVIGPRLTNSPNMKRANEWTRDTMAEWGMQNAHLESWGPFGRGWQLNNFSAQVNAPMPFPLIAYPKAWSPSTKGAVTGDVVKVDIKSEADFAKYKGKLKGKIVLASPIRELKADFDGMASRATDSELLELANALNPGARQRRGNRGGMPEMTPELRKRLEQFLVTMKVGNFLIEEGAAVIMESSPRGSGGTIFVQGASVAQDVPDDPMEIFSRRDRLSPQDKAAEAKMIPQVVVAIEDYNRLARMIDLGVTPKITINVDAQYFDDDLMGYNTIAEIPGTDPKLKDEVVMLGGHLDSWHSGTGATDNAAGCAVMMEAARIILASGLKPRRTIRVALWSGEEQGLNGSRAYVKQHFGEMEQNEGSAPTLKKTAEYEKFSAYYNLDNGTGKIRGVYMQGNDLVRPYFAEWLRPFAKDDASTLTLSNTGGTDHLSFDAIGLPGFQFIQDEIEYGTRTHHSNQDVYDRIQAGDMQQAATIIAAFVYQTAMMDEKLPHKPMN